MLKSTPTCPLPDIREARIDPTLPVNERLRLFAAAIGDPHLSLIHIYSFRAMFKPSVFFIFSKYSIASTIPSPVEHVSFNSCNAK